MTPPAPGEKEPAGEAGPAEPGLDGPAATRRRAAQQRLRRQVFGDVLDGSTLDDRPEPGPPPDGDRWLRDNVPPHHGG